MPRADWWASSRAISVDLALDILMISPRVSCIAVLHGVEISRKKLAFKATNVLTYDVENKCIYWSSGRSGSGFASDRGRHVRHVCKGTDFVWSILVSLSRDAIDIWR